MMSRGELSLQNGRQLLKSNWGLLKDLQTDQEKKLPVPEQQHRVDPGAELVDLLSPRQLADSDFPALKLFRDRKSRRSLGGASLSGAEISYLLYATQGIRKHTPKYSLRTVPSAGARHSFETYLHVTRVENFARGLYRYQPVEHKLCFLFDSDTLEEELNEALMGQKFNSAATFIWTTVPYRMEWRYALIAHKLIAIDAGHVCQNLYLACESIGCGTCAIGAYDQLKLDKVVGVDGEEEFAVYAAPVGRAGD
jgi:SagB-type dehydrogenase family enzyme